MSCTLTTLFTNTYADSAFYSLSHFPFVVVPADTSVESLRQVKPFLLLSILAAAAYDDVPLQQRLGREVQDWIARKIIYEGSTSLEDLQALLVHVAW